MFPGPTESRLIGYSIELIWTQKSKSSTSTSTPKTTCRHANQAKFHTWRMESSFLFVQHYPFQFYSLFWSDGKKSTTKFRWRKSHSEVEANDEPCCKESLNSVIVGVRKSGEEKLWKSKSLECQSWGIWLNGDTRCWQRPKNRALPLSRTICSTVLKVEWWQSLVFSRMESW